jgi:predicted porin
LTFGALYGFGGVAGSFSSGNTVSLGVNYSSGWFAAGAAYTDVKYLQMNNGQDGIRNFGAGMRYSFGPVMTSVFLICAYREHTGPGANRRKLVARSRMDTGWQRPVHEGKCHPPEQ